MDHAYIDENSLIDRYVRGTLPAEERSRFEEHFVDCPSCLDQLEIARSMRAALRHSTAEPKAAQQAARTPGFSSWRWLAAALTACLALAVVMGAVLYRSLERSRDELGKTRLALTRAVAQSATQDPPMMVALNIVRGSGEPTRIAIPQPPRWLVFTVELDASQFAGYRASLRRQDGRVIWQQEDLSPASPGTLAIPLFSTNLPPGASTLTLEGREASGRSVPIYSFAIQGKVQPGVE